MLLVEDDEADAEFLREMLADSATGSFELSSCVHRIRDAITFLRSQTPDLILMDLSLPDSAGLDGLHELQQRAPYTPIIVLSGMDDEEMALRSVHEGAQDYLAKGRTDAPLLLRSMRYAMERQHIEETLAKERNVLRSLLDNIPDNIYAKDIRGRYVIDNAAHLRWVNAKSIGQVAGKTVFDFFPEEIASLYHADDMQVISTGEPILNREEPAISPTGLRRWVSTTKVPVKDSRGRTAGLVCIGRDITERKAAEEKLLKANAELTRSREELLLAVDGLKKAHEELRSVQLQLIEAEKLKSIGRLAAGVAHEVKNPLAVILIGTEYLLGQKVLGESNVRPVLEEIACAVKRADAVVRGLLDFSAPRQLDLQEEDLNRVIENSLLFIRGEMMRNPYQVIKELEAGLPRLKIDAAKIGQVFVNVLTNAIHAMEKGGVLTVRTYSKQLTGVGENIGDCRSENFRVGDRVVVAEVEDTGSGIANDTFGKVFDPFFTTKATGKGTGLGLSVTKTIIDLHGGTIDIQNRPEGGVRVTVTLKV